MNQFEIWKARPEGFGTAHYFVLISGTERCQNPQLAYVNGLLCVTLRGQPKRVDVVLNGADGLDHATVCDCSYFYSLPKSQLKEKLGTVGHERQQQIKQRLRDVLRLH